MSGPSPAQMRALQSAEAGPLQRDQKGWLCFNGADGSRHKWDPVYVAIKQGWLRWMPNGPFRNPEKVTLTIKGRALLSRPHPQEDKP